MVFVCECRYTHVIVYVQRSEDNFREDPSTIRSKDQTQVVRLVRQVLLQPELFCQSKELF